MDESTVRVEVRLFGGVMNFDKMVDQASTLTAELRKVRVYPNRQTEVRQVEAPDLQGDLRIASEVVFISERPSPRVYSERWRLALYKRLVACRPGMEMAIRVISTKEKEAC